MHHHNGRTYQWQPIHFSAAVSDIEYIVQLASIYSMVIFLCSASVIILPTRQLFLIGIVCSFSRYSIHVSSSWGLMRNCDSLGRITIYNFIIKSISLSISSWYSTPTSTGRAIWYEYSKQVFACTYNALWHKYLINWVLLMKLNLNNVWILFTIYGICMYQYIWTCTYTIQRS